MACDKLFYKYEKGREGYLIDSEGRFVFVLLIFLLLITLSSIYTECKSRKENY